MTNEEIHIASINQSFSDWSKTIKSHLGSISDMLSDKTIASIINEYNARKADKTDLGFNIFTIISDLYYRENFHRDVIYEFLNPNGSHGQGNKYLMLFLDMLGISPFDFQNATVEKEYPIDNRRRIDTLIIDDTSKKAIIIENKMNNAGDMDKQLPDYYNYVQKKYEVLSIVYLPLLHGKAPDKSDWSQTEIESVNKCLSIIPAFSHKGEKNQNLGVKNPNLCDDWLLNCINKSDNIDCKSGLRQYVKLIKYLNINSMDYVILEKFCGNLKVGENLKAAISIRSMLNELPAFLAKRVEDRYRAKHDPFGYVGIYGKTDALFADFKLNGEKQKYKLDVWCSENGYDMQFWNEENEQEDITSIFPNLDALKDFRPKQGEPNKVFLHIGFYEEEKVYCIIDTLLKELSDMKMNE